MRTGILTRAMAGTLAAAMLLTGLCGCNTGGETPTPTDATTTASDTATTTVPETTTTTPDNTKTDTTAATDIPTTEPTKEPTLQTGGSSFTIDGLTFTMDTSPKELLNHLGEPKKVNEAGEATLGGIQKNYYYEHIEVETFSMEKVTDEILTAVYFTDSHYAIDNVAVGDTVKTLEERIGSKVPLEHSYTGIGAYAGPGYCYWNEANHMQWWFFFEESPEFMEIYRTQDGQEPTAPPDTPIDCIVIRYRFNAKYYPIARAAGVIDY